MGSGTSGDEAPGWTTVGPLTVALQARLRDSGLCPSRSRPPAAVRLSLQEVCRVEMVATTPSGTRGCEKFWRDPQLPTLAICLPHHAKCTRTLGQAEIRMNILLIDDDASLRKSLRLALEAMGHRVAEARDGEQSQSQLGHGVFDVAFLDLRLA